MRAYFFWKSNTKSLAFGFALRRHSQTHFFDPRERRFRTFVTVLLSLLLHCLLLWLGYKYVQMSQGGASGPRVQTLNVSLADNAKKSATPAPVEPQPAQEPAAPAPSEPEPRPRRNILASKSPTPLHVPSQNEQNPLPLPPLPQSNQPAQPDMSDMLNAKREARAAAEAHERQLEANGGSEESANDRAKRIIASNLASAKGKEYQQGDGGMFEVTDKSLHTATLIFNGWDWKVGRKFPREFPVTQGSEPNIDMAIIDKVIEVIRETHPIEFQWDSQRLGKTVTRSARKEDTADLRAFLFAEFNYGDEVEYNHAQSAGDPPPPRRGR